jgi:hypothetical protein
MRGLYRMTLEMRAIDSREFDVIPIQTKLFTRKRLNTKSILLI